MIDFNQILGKMLGGGGGGAGAGFGTGLAGGLAASMLTTRKGRRVGTSALKYGGIAALGALAWNAYNKSQAGNAQGQAASPQLGPSADELVPPPAASGFTPAKGDTAAEQKLGLTLVRAMIAAAHADGEMDGAESKRILEAFGQVGLTAEEKGALIDEMSKPLGIDELAAAATSPEVATEIYGASLLAIQIDHPAEQAYLKKLATRLGLPPETVASVHEQVGAPAV